MLSGRGTAPAKVAYAMVGIYFLFGVAELLRSYLTLAEPMAEGQTYRWISTFRDLNGEGTIKAAIDLDVVE